MKLMDKLPKAFRRTPPMTKEKERELLAIVQLGEAAERFLSLPDFQTFLRPLLQAYKETKTNQSYLETEFGRKLQLLGNAQAIDDIETEIRNVIQSGKKAASELQTKRTQP